MSPSGPPSEAKLTQLLQAWADGKITLREVRGYTDEELYALSRTAYFFYHQGRLAEARTLYQGLYALDPANGYFARALGVVEMADKNPQAALQAYDVALKLDPRDAVAYVGRAEIRLIQGQRPQAMEDLRKAAQCVNPDDALAAKISAMLGTFEKRSREIR